MRNEIKLFSMIDEKRSLNQGYILFTQYTRYTFAEVKKKKKNIYKFSHGYETMIIKIA